MSAPADPGAEAVFARVRKVVAEVLNLPEESITRDSRFIEDLHADSFDLLSLMMGLEDEFEREISEGQAQTLETVGATVDFIHRHSGEG